MENTLGNNKIEINKEVLNHLNTIRKWTMFLAITGFIFLGLIVIFGLIAGTFLSAFNAGENSLGIPEPLMLVIFSLLAVAYFFPIHFLFRFSKYAAHAVETLDVDKLCTAFRNLKFFFAYLGVFIIIILTAYIVLLVVSGTTLTLPGLG